MAEYIIDTNVWVVASGGHEGAFGDCVMACIELLSGLREQGAALVMDESSFLGECPGNSVLRELKDNLREGGYGHDLFWNHVFHNGCFTPVRIDHDDEGAALPMVILQREQDGSTNSFEPSDRKWIALQLAHPLHPEIHNAVDGDWEKARQDLATYGIRVKQLCRGCDIP